MVGRSVRNLQKARYHKQHTRPDELTSSPKHIQYARNRELTSSPITHSVYPTTKFAHRARQHIQYARHKLSHRARQHIHYARRHDSSIRSSYATVIRYSSMSMSMSICGTHDGLLSGRSRAAGQAFFSSTSHDSSPRVMHFRRAQSPGALAARQQSRKSKLIDVYQLS